MIFCKNCGKENTYDSKFCSGCGSKLGETTNINLNINENWKETVLSNNIEDIAHNEIKATSYVTWNAPREFYEKYSKYYEISPKLIDVAIQYGIAEKESDLVICYGTYYSNIDTIIIFVKKDEVVIGKINSKKPENNKIVYFPRNSVELASTYNPKKMQFDTDDLLGFRITKATEMSLKKKYTTYFEMLKVILPRDAENYFLKNLRSSFKVIKEVEEPDWKSQIARINDETGNQDKRITKVDSTQIKICLNCGDILLEQAKRCPTCGQKEKNLYLINRNETETIQEIKNSVPNPKGSKQAIWETKPVIKSKKEIVAERKQKAEVNGFACCPKCGSTSLSGNKQGFGIGKAVIGASLTMNPLGLIGGNINAKKVRVTCLKCGHQFYPR